MVYLNKESIVMDNLYVSVIIFKKGLESDTDAMNQAIELIQSET